MLNMYNTVHVTQTRKNLFPSNSSKHTQPHSLFQMTQNSVSVNCLATYVCCSLCMFKFIISFLKGGVEGGKFKFPHFSLLWNIFICGGTMFVGSQNFPAPWGRNLVDSVIRIILIDIKQIIVYRFMGMYIRG